MAEPGAISADAETRAKWERYAAAKEAKSRWSAEEKAAKEDLLEDLGFDPDDEKPGSVDVVDEETEEPLFSVKVGSRKGLDIKYLRSKHPDVYAECEKWTYPISVKAAE